jgi:hypothetical protein
MSVNAVGLSRVKRRRAIASYPVVALRTKFQMSRIAARGIITGYVVQFYFDAFALAAREGRN